MSIPLKFPCPVLRIRLAWVKGMLRIEKVMGIPRMTLLKSVELPKSVNLSDDGVSGFWYELIDAKGHVLYRRMMEDSREGEIVNADGSFSREGINRDKVMFDVLIPDLTESKQLRFFAQKRPRTVAMKPAVFKIQELTPEKRTQESKHGKK